MGDNSPREFREGALTPDLENSYKLLDGDNIHRDLRNNLLGKAEQEEHLGEQSGRREGGVPGEVRVLVSIAL